MSSSIGFLLVDFLLTMVRAREDVRHAHRGSRGLTWHAPQSEQGNDADRPCQFAIAPIVNVAPFAQDLVQDGSPIDILSCGRPPCSIRSGR